MAAVDMHQRNTRILIVDDQDANINLLERLLQQAGYKNLITTTDPRQALPLFLTQQPDIILLDLHMPHLDGFGVLEQLRPRLAERAYLPILVLSADITPEAKQRALSLGARDFVAKPFDHQEVLLRIKNLLETRALHSVLRNHNTLLEERVRERTQDFEEAQFEILVRLALAAEFRDDDTGRHAQRVGLSSALIAKELGMPGEDVASIRRTAPLHDVGKIGISDTILLKPGKLTQEEFEIMKTHTTLGGRILSGSRFQVLQFAEDIALTHHERWDGGGYVGLKGEAIPMVGRIVAVADVFDALTHTRPYKPAWPIDEALAEISDQAGRQFDPNVVAAFLRTHEPETIRLDEFEEIDAVLPDAEVPLPEGETFPVGVGSARA